MVRKSYALFAVLMTLFALALTAPAHADTKGKVCCGGGFLGPDQTYVSTYINSGNYMVSLVTSKDHIWGYLTAADSVNYISANRVDIKLNVNYNTTPATMTGTLTRASSTSPWTVTFTVRNGSSVLATFPAAALKGSASIVMPLKSLQN